MIYRIEKRTISGGGTIESHFELISYVRRTPIGVLVGGKTLYKHKKKTEVVQFSSRKNIILENDMNFIGKLEKCNKCLCLNCGENSALNENRICDGCTYCKEQNLNAILKKSDCALSNEE